MKITAVEPFILHMPLTADSISDSTHSITHWGVVGTRIVTDAGLVGWGFTGTHAHAPSDRLITACIRDCYAPLLIGEDAGDRTRLWSKLARNPALQWVGRAGITQLALAAVDVALWDLGAKAAGLPLWAFLGGATSPKIEAYNTDIGWLSIPKPALVDGARRAVEEDGFGFIKIKVGHDAIGVDLDRLEAVRAAVGPDVKIAIDGNGKWDLPTCLRFAAAARPLDLVWFEEPMWYDDVTGHRRLAESGLIPVALGEQLYSLDAFKEFIAAGAIHYVQPDVTRLGGITEYIEVARPRPGAPPAGGAARRRDEPGPRAPRATGTRRRRSSSTSPGSRTASSSRRPSKDGVFLRPEQPGAGTTPRQEAIDAFAVPLS